MASKTAPSENPQGSVSTIWREMNVNDVESVLRVADIVHPDLPESKRVFTERVKLFPQGCLVLIEDGNICGYAISHPIHYRQPPNLNSLLEEIPPDVDQYYIHDLAILPASRGDGHSAKCVETLLGVAKSFPTTCLVSVYGTASFWERSGFVAHAIDGALLDKLQGYGEDAQYLERKNERWCPSRNMLIFAKSFGANTSLFPFVP